MEKRVLGVAGIIMVLVVVILIVMFLTKSFDRLVFTGKVIDGGDINFIAPTPDNNAVVPGPNVEIKTDILGDLNELDYNWDGQNYKIYDDNLILMYNFNKVDGLGEDSSNVADLSASGYNGNVNGAIWTSNGRYNGAYEFDGNDYIDLGDSIEGLNELTMASWIFAKELPVLEHSEIITKDLVNSFALQKIDGKAHLHFNLGNGVSWFERVNAGEVTLNEWHYVVVTWRKSDGLINMYIDGELSLSVNKPLWVMGGNDLKRGIGGKYMGGDFWTNYFNGIIDEPRVWNKALSGEEIVQHYYSNLNKYDNDKWNLYVDQWKNVGVGLEDGSYTYLVNARDVDGSVGTKSRVVNIGVAPLGCALNCDGKECGSDGCGGNCGDCDDGNSCTVDICDNGRCTNKFINCPGGGKCEEGVCKRIPCKKNCNGKFIDGFVDKNGICDVECLNPEQSYVLLDFEYDNGEIKLIDKSFEKGSYPLLNHDVEREFKVESISNNGKVLYSNYFNNPGLLYSDDFSGEILEVGEVMELENVNFFLTVPVSRDMDKIRILRDGKIIFVESVYS